MRVRRTSWHARVYLWWYAHKYPGFAEYLPTHSNLCPYVRTVLFWAPLRFLFTDWATKWLPISIWPVCLYSVPKLLGWISYDAKHAVWIIEGVVGALVLAILIIGGLSDYSEREGNIFKRFDNWWDKSEERAILVAYARAGHDRFCPEVTLD